MLECFEDVLFIANDFVKEEKIEFRTKKGAGWNAQKESINGIQSQLAK